ncbi:MAG TPA: hypothetical protein VIK21_07185, partial [Desulfuromonadaceae bacterium]
MFRFQQIATAVLIAGMLSMITGCAGHEGLRAGLYKTVVTPAPPVVETIRVSVAPAPPDPQPSSFDYQVGIGDVLSINVYARP